MQNVSVKKFDGRPVQKTYDAIYLGGHYKDPRSISLRVKSILSALFISSAIVLPMIEMIH